MIKKFAEFVAESYIKHAENDAAKHDGGQTETTTKHGDDHGAKLNGSDHHGRLGKELVKRGYTKIQHHNTSGDVTEPTKRVYHKVHNGKDHYVQTEYDGKGNVHVKSYHK